MRAPPSNFSFNAVFGRNGQIICWRPHVGIPGSATAKGFCIVFHQFCRNVRRHDKWIALAFRTDEWRRHTAVRTGKESRLPEEAHLLPFSTGWFLFSAGWLYFWGTCEEDISAMWSSQSNQMASNFSQIPRWNYLHLTSSGSASYRQRKGRRAEQILKWEYVCSVLSLTKHLRKVALPMQANIRKLLQ